MIIRTKFNGYAADGTRRHFKGGGGSVKYDNLEQLYAIQAEQAKSLMDQANANVYPAYNSLLEEAKNTGSQANQEVAAGRAGADVVAAQGGAKKQLEQQLSSMGVNPNDQKFANTMAAMDLDAAAQKAAAMTGARDKTRDLGFAKLTDTVNAGMGIGSNAVAALNSAGGMASNIAGLQQQGQANRDANLGNIAALGTRLLMNKGGLVPRKYAGGGIVGKMAGAPQPIAAPAPVIAGAVDAVGDGGVSSDGFDGGLGSAVGLGSSGNEAGNNGGLGLGSAVGGDGVGMGSAAGNAGDNGAEGGIGGDDADGGTGEFKNGGYVQRFDSGGRVRGGILGALRGINPSPPPPSTRTASPAARSGQQVAAGGAKGAGTLVENVGNLVGKVAPEAGNSVSSFGAGLRLGDKAQPAIEAFQAAAAPVGGAAGAATAGEVAGAAAEYGVSAAGEQAAMLAAQEAGMGTLAAGAEAAGTSAAAMGAGSAIGSALSAAMPWVGGALLIGSALDLFADGGEVKAHTIDGQQGSDGVADSDTGGAVEGPGGPKEDKVLARLSPGEFVMPVATVKMYGLERLEKMRKLGLRHEKQLGIR